MRKIREKSFKTYFGQQAFGLLGPYLVSDLQKAFTEGAPHVETLKKVYARFLEEAFPDGLKIKEKGIASLVETRAEADPNDPVDLIRSLHAHLANVIDLDQALGFMASLTAGTDEHIDSEAVRTYIHGQFSEMYLSSILLLERVFRQYKKPEQILGILTGSMSNSDSIQIAAAMASYPVEATIVRTETLYPEMRTPASLYHALLRHILDKMAEPQLHVKPTTYHLNDTVLGAEYGPRTRRLTGYGLDALLMFWADQDQEFPQLIKDRLSDEMDGPVHH